MTTPIDWKRAQTRLCVKPDGNPGPITYTALFARLAASGAAPAVTSALGAAAARWFGSFGISASVERLSDLLAQGWHETAGFRVWEENLRYTAERIRQIWPSRFPSVASARPYAWNPRDADREDIALANKVYGDRMGNETNGLADDDGWNSRGMGLLMSTGLANRRAAKQRLGVDLVACPDLAADPATSLEIACDFYRAEGVLTAIDEGDLVGARRIVNLGNRYAKATPLGWSEVQKARARALSVLA